MPGGPHHPDAATARPCGVGPRGKRIHVRDDLYLSRECIDVGALNAFSPARGRVHHGRQHLHHAAARKASPRRWPRNFAEQLDGKVASYSPIDTADWSPSARQAVAK